MHLIWAIYGITIALVVLVAVLDAYFGLPTLADVSLPEWDRQPQGRHPRLSVVVPARNEAEAIGACLGSLLGQNYDNFEVIVINDRSTDSTGEIVDRIAATAPARFRVLHIRELPPGWLGKPHAMWQAAAIASGDWLLFTDADVMFRSDSLRRAVAYAESVRADHFVLAPTMLALTLGERLMMGMIQMAFIAMRPWKVPDPRSRAFIGWGAFNMLRRGAYEKIGAMLPLRMEIVEDMELGRLVKRAGLRSCVALGPELVQIRWGRGLFGPVRNLTKNFYAALKFRWWLALLLVLAVLAFHVVPFAAIGIAPGWSKLPFAIELAGLFCIYFRLRKLYGISPAFFLINWISASLLAFAILRSAVVTHRQGGVVWRGTKYPIDELRRAQRHS